VSKRAEIHIKKLGFSALLLMLSTAAGAETLTGIDAPEKVALATEQMSKIRRI